MSQSHCKNCDQALVEDSQYCHHCGQGTRDYHENFWSVVSSHLHELLDIDGRMFRTLKVLITQPGELSRAFNQGQRVHYSPPLRLYLAISILFFLLIAYLGPVYSGGFSSSEVTSDYYARALFILFPFFAALVQLFFPKSRMLENLVFALHIHCFVYLGLMIVAPLEANEHRHDIFIWLQLPPALYICWYCFKAFHRVFDETWVKVIPKTLAIIIIYSGLLGIAFDVVLEEFITPS